MRGHRALAMLYAPRRQQCWPNTHIARPDNATGSRAGVHKALEDDVTAHRDGDETAEATEAILLEVLR